MAGGHRDRRQPDRDRAEPSLLIRQPLRTPGRRLTASPPQPGTHLGIGGSGWRSASASVAKRRHRLGCDRRTRPKPRVARNVMVPQGACVERHIATIWFFDSRCMDHVRPRRRQKQDVVTATSAERTTLTSRDSPGGSTLQSTAGEVHGKIVVRAGQCRRRVRSSSSDGRPATLLGSPTPAVRTRSEAEAKETRYSAEQVAVMPRSVGSPADPRHRRQQHRPVFVQPTSRADRWKPSRTAKQQNEAQRDSSLNRAATWHLVPWHGKDGTTAEQARPSRCRLATS